MSEKYTPTTEEVRRDYSTRMAPASDGARAVQFDIWLNRRDKKVASDAIRNATKTLTTIQAGILNCSFKCGNSKCRDDIRIDAVEEAEAAMNAYADRLEGEIENE